LDARPLDRTALALAKNDVVVLPLNNSYLFVLPDNLASEESIREVPTCRWLAVMNEDCGAGYYSDGWGPLPFAFGRVPPDSYVVLRAR
jgi:hypothetical protein